MKVIVNALKAPWPEGTRVGSVVDLDGDVIPAWAAGKCSPVPQADEKPAEPEADGKVKAKK